VLLHALAAAGGKKDWHVLCAMKDELSRSGDNVHVRMALMSCVDMLHDVRRQVDNDTVDTIDQVLIEAQRALEGTGDNSSAPSAPSALLEAAELVVERWERGDLAEAVRMLNAAVNFVKESSSRDHRAGFGRP